MKWKTEDAFNGFLLCMAIRKLVHLSDSNSKSKSQCTMYNRTGTRCKLRLLRIDAILDHKATRLRLRHEASIIHILIRHRIDEMLIHRFAATQYHAAAGKTESQCGCCWPWP